MDVQKDSHPSPGEPPVLTKLQPLNQIGKDVRNNQLPRGCRFPSLNEAHRNITGRSLSNGEISLHSTSSASSLRQETKALPSLPQGVPRSKKEHIRALDAAQAHSQQSLDAGDSDLDPIDEVIRQISNPPTPTSLTSPITAPPHKRNADAGVLRPTALATPEQSPTQSASPCGDTNNTEGHQYKPGSAQAVHTPSPSSSGNNTSENKSTAQASVHKHHHLRYSTNDSHAPPGRDGAVTRLGFRVDTAAKIRPMSDSGNLYSASGNNLIDRDAMATDRVRVHSLLLASLPTRDSLLYPMPLRVQSMRAEGKRMSSRSALAMSATDMASDSDDDPFRYDKEAYKFFLHPSKEREVSAALIHASGMSSHSKATLFGQDNPDAVPAQVKPFPFSPAPARSPSPGRIRTHIDNHVLLSDSRMRSITPESNDGFYDSSVVQPNWALEDGDGAYEVKIVLQDANTNPTTPAPKRCLPTAENKTDSRADKCFPVPATRGVANKSLYRVADKENRDVLSSERDEWETVATSAPAFGTAGRSAPLGFPLPADRMAKITGSSVADVSDDSSFCQPFDEYASTDRIVQHPSGQDDSEESLQIRHMSGTRFPVIVPKQRVHRVNGFAQESSRLFTPPSSRPGGDAAAALARKVSNPFQQLSGRSSRPLPAPIRLQPLAPLRRDNRGRNRFEFRMSQGSDCEALCEPEPDDSNDSTGGVQGGSSHAPAADEQSDGPNAKEDGFLRASRSSGGTVHSFAFPLIPLPEAARLQASKRTAGDANDTAGLQYRTANQRHPSKSFAAGSGGFRAPMRTHSRKPRNFLLPSVSSRFGLPKSGTALSAISSTTGGGGTWATIAPFGSTSTRVGAPGQTLKSAVAKLHLGSIVEKLKPQTAPRSSFSIGSSTRSRRSGRNTPHLYPWDYQHQQQCWQHHQQQQQQQHQQEQQRPRGTDPELRAIAVTDDSLLDRQALALGVGTPAYGLERMGVPLPLDPDAFLSRATRRRRRLWFAGMLAVSVLFPFIAVLVYLGKLDSGLSWYTRGEVDRLSVRQRRVILFMAVLQFALWPSIIVAVVWRVQGM